VSHLAAVQIAASVLAVAVLLGSVAARLLPPGAWRRGAWDMAIVLGCASPALALLGPYLEGRIWPGAAIIAAGYGGFHLIRSWQLRRADQDGVRRLLGLEKTASYGEVLLVVERIEPKPLTAGGRAVIGVGAVAALIAGALVGRFEIAVIALLLGAAETTVRGAYRRALAARVRSIGR
jgi:hypothetical protein